MTSSSAHSLRVLVVEDEPKLLENLIIGLTHCGLEVTGVADGVGLDSVLEQNSVDVIVLDLGLPGEDGIEIAKRLRKWPNTGLIIVTARGMTEDRIIGFESGADVYFVKPVDIKELAAAIRSIGRRLSQTSKSGWHLDMESSSLITPKKISIRLNAKERTLMKFFLLNIGTDVPRATILDVLELPNEISFYPRLDVMISRLRSKVIASDPLSPLPIQTRYSSGYTFLNEN